MNRAIALLLAIGLLNACVRKVEYSVEDIPKVESAQLTSFRLGIAVFADGRGNDAENAFILSSDRETKISGESTCVNAEKHYDKGQVPTQIAEMITAHLRQRGAFASVDLGNSANSSYVLTGKVDRFYGAQEVSVRSVVGAYIGGLAGALTAMDAATPGHVEIRFSNLVLDDGHGRRLAIPDVVRTHEGKLPADAHCWLIYTTVNEQLKLAVDTLAIAVEKGIADMQKGEPRAGLVPRRSDSNSY